LSLSLDTVDLESPRFAGLPAKQGYALAHLSGSGGRTWFSGNKDEAAAKEACLKNIREAWLTEILGRTSPRTIFSDEDQRLTPLAIPRTFQKLSSKSGTLADQFASAFPEWKGEQHSGERFGLLAIAAGCALEDFKNVATFCSYCGEVESLASKATPSQAIAESKRLQADRSWTPSSTLNLAPASDAPPAPSLSLEEPIATFGWAKADEMAQALVKQYGLGYLSLDDCMSSSQAVQALSNLGASMALISKETGLGDQAIGLGGWGVRIGEKQKTSAGMCYGHSRYIALANSSGDGAYAHEWFHALDFEFGFAMGQDDLLSEKPDAKGPLAASVQTLVKTLLAPSSQPAAQHKDPIEDFAADFLVNSGVRSSLPTEKTQAFDSAWKQAAGAMFAATSAAEEKKAFESLKSVYRSERPSLSDGDFDGIWSGFVCAKRPNPSFVKKMEQAQNKSAFFHAALTTDLRENEHYRAMPCELLARAFESSFALDAAREKIGSNSNDKGISMVSSYPDTSRDVPQGIERDRSRAAFDRFFSEIKTTLAHDPKAPAWAAELKTQPLEADASRLIAKLIARRGDGSLSTSKPASASKSTTLG
jgi:hypothetical protein